MNKIDRKLLSLMTIEERFKYIQKKKINEFNKKVHRRNDDERG